MMGAIFSCGKCQQKVISYCECSPKEENYPHESIMQAEIDQLRAEREESEELYRDSLDSEKALLEMYKELSKELNRHKKVVDTAIGVISCEAWKLDKYRYTAFEKAVRELKGEE